MPDNPLLRLRDALAARYPDLPISVDPPDDPAGSWFLDVRPGGDAPLIVVEWKPSLGFGVSTPGPDDFGTKPDELYTNTKAAYDRIVRLVLSGGRTSPPTAVQLAELRALRGLTQPELAARAGMGQSNLSRIEGRKAHSFTLILSAPTTLTPAFMDALFEAGCDDSTPSLREGVVRLAFDREAGSLGAAIGSAVDDAGRAGGVVAGVDVDDEGRPR